MLKKRKPYRLFAPGQIVSTPAVLAKVPGDELTAALTRHLSGDWGDTCESDAMLNNQAMKNGDRIFSVYHSKAGEEFWIITEWDRSATTILLPSDYRGGWNDEAES